MTLAGSERSNPTSASSLTPSPVGDREREAAKRNTSGNSPLSCWVTKKAAIVAATIRANVARTNGWPWPAER